MIRGPGTGGAAICSVADIWWGVTVNQRSKENIAEIEATQAALRDSIQATKQLAEKAETLLQQHKEALEKESAKRSE
jgi:hypothetical protein